MFLVGEAFNIPYNYLYYIYCHLIVQLEYYEVKAFHVGHIIVK